MTATNLTATMQGVTPQNFRDDEHTILATQNFQLAAILAVKTAVQSVVNVFSGSLIDRFGYGVPMFVGTVALLLTAIGYGFGQSYTVLLVSAALHGIGSSCVTVGGMTMLARIFNDKEERAKTFRTTLSSMAIGMTEQEANDPYEVTQCQLHSARFTRSDDNWIRVRGVNWRISRLVAVSFSTLQIGTGSLELLRNRDHFKLPQCHVDDGFYVHGARHV
ncbi:unnamed protein product [Clavelina lepadiformis]|uniref:Major facilitator superfamily (MFS) profile domain-containing protein n=1 Tax=Clavelina lepadiformis TaxID=159417 RepID=A0ABP0G820_CLALP